MIPIKNLSGIRGADTYVADILTKYYPEHLIEALQKEGITGAAINASQTIQNTLPAIYAATVPAVKPDYTRPAGSFLLGMFDPQTRTLVVVADLEGLEREKGSYDMSMTQMNLDGAVVHECAHAIDFVYGWHYPGKRAMPLGMPPNFYDNFGGAPLSMMEDFHVAAKNDLVVSVYPQEFTSRNHHFVDGPTWEKFAEVFRRRAGLVNPYRDTQLDPDPMAILNAIVNNIQFDIGTFHKTLVLDKPEIMAPAANRIYDSIMNGSLKPGDKLTAFL